jgi:hypothetical protein
MRLGSFEAFTGGFGGAGSNLGLKPAIFIPAKSNARHNHEAGSILDNLIVFVKLQIDTTL